MGAKGMEENRSEGVQGTTIRFVRGKQSGKMSKKGYEKIEEKSPKESRWHAGANHVGRKKNRIKKNKYIKGKLFLPPG